ncbi:MAG: nucleoside triphosphate pyrophosphohydrolase [Deltaproteobacteria bacterium]|nr:nucleoside triphosphate pyrophosphohydrolase [Deltaproteobacteria bacterium]
MPAQEPGGSWRGDGLDCRAVSDETPLPEVNLEPLPGKQTGGNLPRLVGLMQRLLAPDGCPWDREQTLATLLPYLVEETYEVVDALQGGTVADHREELGDLLLQVIFQAELRHKEGAFGIDDVIEGIVRKLVRRHPHVFGEVHAKNADEALASWAKLKASEKAKKGKKGALHGIPRSAPALVRAMRAGEKAGAVGFDWPDAAGVRDKVREELAEFDQACRSGDRRAMSRELGDLLFAIVNLARKLDLDAEHDLREATDRFGRRFAYMEDKLAAQGRAVEEASSEEQNALWEEAKKAEVT